MRAFYRISGLAIAMVLAIGLAAWPAHADKIAPSGPLKAYKGPEGELVALVEISDGKEMLVYCKNLGGELEGKTVRYLLDDRGDAKDVYINKKRGSKTYRSMLLTARDGRWELYPPGKNQSLPLRYSEEASGKLKLDDVLAALKP